MGRPRVHGVPVLLSGEEAEISGINISYFASQSDLAEVSGVLESQITGLSGYVDSVSGNLQSGISGLQASVPSWNEAYLLAVTGIEVTGTDTKTILLYSLDGVISANFTDLQATGFLTPEAEKYIESGFLNTGNGILHLYRAGDDADIEIQLDGRYLTGVNLSSYATTGFVTGVSGVLQGQINVLTGQTGSYVTTSQTGAFYPRSNPSGFITGVDLSSYSTIGHTHDDRYYTEGEITSLLTGKLGVSEKAADADKLDGFDSSYFYPRSNPSGFITGVDLVGYSQTGHSHNDLYYTEGEVNNLLTGKLGALSQATDSDKLDGYHASYFYPAANPSGFITGVELSSYATQAFVTGVSGALDQRIDSLENQTGDYISTSQTGAFYPSSNPDGFITSSALVGYATESFVTGVSGYLESQISVANSDVSSLNSLTGNIIVSGSGTVEVTTTGSTIVISSQTGFLVNYQPSGSYVTTSETGAFYPNNNPSGFITGIDLSSYALESFVTGISGELDSRIDILEGQSGSYALVSDTGIFITSSQTGNFYTSDNPSGFITGVDLSSYATHEFVTGISGELDNRLDALEGQTGSYVLDNETGNFITSSQTGAFYSADNPAGYITGVDLSSYATQVFVTGISGELDGRIDSLETQTGSYALAANTGSFVTSDQTGAFYAVSNPSGFITGVDLSSYATEAYVTGISGYLESQIIISNADISSLNGLSGDITITGGGTVEASTSGNFIVISGDTGFLSAYQGTGDYVLATDTGDFITNAQTGVFYSADNPSGFITGVDLSNYATEGFVTGISGELDFRINSLEGQTGSFVTTSQTGAFYPTSNPSGFITGVDLSDYATESFVTGASGALDSRIWSLEEQTGNYALAADTGNFVTTSQTGEFYPASNPSGFITGVDLSTYATEDFVTGVSGYLVSQIALSDADVDSLNGLSGVVEISGAGTNIVTVTGSLIVVSGDTGFLSAYQPTGDYVFKSETGEFITSVQTGDFYSVSNPSGYITGVDLSTYATQSFVTGVSGDLDARIDSLEGQTGSYALAADTGSFVTTSQTGVFYTIDNPSGFITGVDLSGYATIDLLTGASGVLDNRIAVLESGTGLYALASNTGSFVTTDQTGIFYTSDNPSGYITGIDLSDYATEAFVTGASGALDARVDILEGQTGSYALASDTGSFVTTSETGQFYASSNPSGFITNISLVGYATEGFVTGITDGLDSRIDSLEGQTGSYVLTNETGAFYPVSNPSGYITGVDLSAYATTTFVTGASGSLQDQITALDNATGFYVLDNETGSFITTAQTGEFYSSSNPSGFITGVDLSAYATEDFVTGVSGFLIEQINLNSAGISSLNGLSGILEISGAGINSVTTDGSLIIVSGSTGFLSEYQRTGDYVEVSETGNFITSSQTGEFYAASNPSGFITGVDLSAYATTVFVTGVSGSLDARIDELEGQTGSYALASDTGNFISSSQTGIFYTIDNPSGFITGVDLSAYATQQFVTGISGELDSRIGVLEGQTGGFALSSDTGNFVTTFDTGAFYPNSNPSGFITGIDLSSYATEAFVTGISGEFDSRIDVLEGQTGEFALSSDTGNFITTAQTGEFYSISNPSGYITGVDLSSYATQSYVTGVSGALDARVDILEGATGSYALAADTGSFVTTQQTGEFYSASNPSGYITGVDLSLYATQAYVTGASGTLDARIGNLEGQTGSYVLDNETGSFVTTFDTGAFYSSANPSGFITGVDLSDYATEAFVTGVSGYLVSQIALSDADVDSLNDLSGAVDISGAGITVVFNTGNMIVISGDTGFLIEYQRTGDYVLTSETGAFYPTSNPSGYITGVDLSTYATIDYVTGASGSLQDQITSLGNATGSYVLDNETGSFVTTSQTGQFYAASNPDGFITSSALIGYATEDYVTGISGQLDSRIDLLENQTGSFALSSDTGNFLTTAQTGDFYSASNPSGYITGVDLSLYATESFVTGVSGELDDRIFSLESSTGLYVLASDTGLFITSAQTGAFYSASNPSGFITGIDLSAYATTEVVTGISGVLDNRIFVLEGQTGDYVLASETGSFVTSSQTGVFYTNDNPSGFITGVDLSSYATQAYVTGISGYLESQIALSDADVDSLNGLSGAVNISGAGTNSIIVTGTTVIVSGSTGFLSEYQPSGSYIQTSETGVFVTTSETGAFYSASNPSGFITGVDLAGYATEDYVTGISGILDSRIGVLENQTGEFALASDTGLFITTAQTGEFYSVTNPSGFITGVDLSAYATEVFVTGASGYLDSRISNLENETGSYALSNETGSFITSYQTGAFYPNDNPSGFITGVDLSSYATESFVTGVSGTLDARVDVLENQTGEFALAADTGNFVTTLQTGEFYSSSNPSGFITGVDLSAYATEDYVTGISGYLVSQIDISNADVDSLNGLSGSINISGAGTNFVITTGALIIVSGDTGFLAEYQRTGNYVESNETGAFYPASNPSGFITGVDLSSYATIEYVTGTSGMLAEHIGELEGQTGSYALAADTGSFITTSQTGDFYAVTNPSGFITGVDLSSYATTSFVTGISGELDGRIDLLEGATGSFALTSDTGSFITSSQTGAFYAASNPDGFITNIALVGYATEDYVTGVSGYLEGLIEISNADVSSLNSLSGVLVLSGSGNVSVTATGSTIVVFGETGFLTNYQQTGDYVLAAETGGFITADQTGAFYSSSNPSGFITGVDLSSYTTEDYVSGISGQLDSRIDSLEVQTGSYALASDTGSFITTAQTGEFYSVANPSGFITGMDLSSYATEGFVTGISGELDDRIFSLENSTGSYALASDTGSFVTSAQTGVFYTANNPSGFITGVDLSSYATEAFVTGASGELDSRIVILENQTGDFVLSSDTGSFITTAQTGAFYSTTNPSGYITGVDLSAYATEAFVTGVSGYLESQIALSDADVDSLNGLSGTVEVSGAGTNTVSVTGNLIVVSGTTGFLSEYQRTGSYVQTSETGAFYPASNPSGFITGIDLSSYATTVFVTGISGELDSRLGILEGQTGDFVLSAETGAFYPASNPSGFITGVDLSAYATESFVTGISGELDGRLDLIEGVTGSFVTTDQTGVFYTNDNPSGYITGVDLSAYATEVFVTGISGELDARINGLEGQTGNYVLSNETGSFITTSDTGAFYSSANPSGYITGVDLSTYATIGYVTGASGSLQDQITVLDNATGSYALANETGSFITTSQTGQFYAATNPSGFITGVDLSSYATQSFVTGVSGELDIRLGSLEGQTGSFYTNDNPSGFITGVDLSNYTTVSFVTGISGELDDRIFSLENATGSYALVSDTGSFITSAQTGAFYAASNPDGFITNIALVGYATENYVTGVSGYLEGLIEVSNADVSSLNGLSGDLTITGSGNVSVTATGSTILIFGQTGFLTNYQLTGDYVLGAETGNFITSDQTGVFYGADNPSGYITGIDLSAYATEDFVTGTSGALDERIFVLETQTGSYILDNETGVFYTNDNPSGYITGVDLSSYATIALVTGVSGIFDERVNVLEGQTGDFALASDTGSFITTSQTGAFYSITNPSGYITGVDLSTYATEAFVTGVSGYLESQIALSDADVDSLNGLSGAVDISGVGITTVSITGNLILVSGDTGFLSEYQRTGDYVQTSETGVFYPTSNPSGFITGVDLSSYATTVFVTGISGELDSRLDILEGQTGSFVLNAETGVFYTNDNPSGFITGVDLSSYATTSYVTGISGVLDSRLDILEGQTGEFITNAQTGAFYSSTNPSGFITGMDLSSYATQSFVTGISGELDGRIDSLELQTGSYVLDNETGNFVTTNQTGEFYSVSNPSGYITGVDLSAYATEDFVTGVSGYLVSQIALSDADVDSLNGLSGVLDITGAGINTVSVSGSLIIVSGSTGFLSEYQPVGSYVTTDQTGSFITSSQTGEFYAASNPSGFITGVDLSSYATEAFVTGASGALDARVDILEGQTGSFALAADTGNFVTTLQTGAFYPTSNPSGFITGIDLSSYATTSYVTGISGQLDARIDSLELQTGSFVLDSETGNFVTTDQTGQFYSVSNPSGYITGIDLSSYATQGYVTGASGSLQSQITALDNATGLYALGSDTGNFITTSQTGQFYAASNPSGFITGVDLSSYATTVYVTGASGSLQSQITALDNATGSYVLDNETGSFITSSALVGYATEAYVTGISGQLDSRIDSLEGQTGSYALSSDTGSFITTAQTGQFYASDNPDGFITSSALIGYATEGFVTGASGYLDSRLGSLEGQTGSYALAAETGSFVTTSETGQFYPTSNPSGFITGIDLSSYATTVYVTGASGTLQSQITALDNATGSYVLDNETGAFITTDQTGQFYAADNPSGFITNSALVGYATESYVTGASGALDVRVDSLEGQTGSYALASDTGNFITTAQTGEFYSVSNPSGFITSIALVGYATEDFVTGASGYLDSRLDSLEGQTGSYVLDNETGSFVTTFQTGQFYSTTNPSGFTTGDTMVNLGLGVGIYSSKVSGEFQLKSLVAGSNIFIDDYGDGELEISAQAVSSLQLFSGAVFLTGAGNITITDDDINTITISGTAGASSDTMTNLGAGSGIYHDKVAGEFQLKSLVAGTNIAITGDDNELTISAPIQNLVYTTGDQIISGIKTLNGDLVVTGSQQIGGWLEVITGAPNPIYIGTIPADINYPGMWFGFDRDTANATNYAFLGGGTNTFLNANGTFWFRAWNSTRAMMDTNGFRVGYEISVPLPDTQEFTVVPQSASKAGIVVRMQPSPQSGALYVQDSSSGVLAQITTGGAFSGSSALFNFRPTVNGSGVLLQGEASAVTNVVYQTGDQDISGTKNFYSRPTVSGTGVLLQGEASAAQVENVVYQTGNQDITGLKNFATRPTVSGTGVHLMGERFSGKLITYTWAIDTPSVGFIAGPRLYEAQAPERVDAWTTGTTGVLFNIEERIFPTGTGINLLAADIGATNAGVSSTTFANNVLDSGSWLFLDLATVSGFPGQMVVNLVCKTTTAL
jgi:hypothetical protein